jgi:hypothetical protein
MNLFQNELSCLIPFSFYSPNLLWKMNTDHRRFHSHSIHRFAAEAACERVIKPQKNSF